MKTILLGTLALVIGAWVSTAQGQIIAIKFTGGNGSTVTDRTGVVGADAATWNNVGGIFTGNSYSGSASNLVETTGAIGDSGTVSGVSLSFLASDPFQTGDTNLGNLFNGYLDGNGATLSPPVAHGLISVTLTNIPFALYDVYAYIAPFPPTSTSPTSSASIGGETLSFTPGSTTDTTFSINSDPSAVDPVVSTLLFSNVSGSSFTYLQDGNNNSSSTGLTGIEIVEVVPEPTTTAMLGLGAGFCVLAWIVRRRHSLA